MKSGRNKKSRPEWITDVEDIKCERRLAGERNKHHLVELNKKPPRRNFSHLKFLVDHHMDNNQRNTTNNGIKPYFDEVAAASARNALIQQQYDSDLVSAYCSAFERATAAATPSSQHISAHARSPLSISDAQGGVSSLQYSCLDSISDHFEKYDAADVSCVLSLLPPEHCSVLSALCCRKDQLTDENISTFAQEHVETLFIGGARLTDRSLDCFLHSSSSSSSSGPPIPGSFVEEPLSVPESWEDCTHSASVTFSSVTSSGSEDGCCCCRSLERLVILSPHISPKGLARIVSSSLWRLNAISLHGKCASVVLANCMDVLIETVREEEEEAKGDGDGRGRLGGSGGSSWHIDCSTDMMSRSDKSSVTTCSVGHLKHSVGWH
jgi:hypothetical protein